MPEGVLGQIGIDITQPNFFLIDLKGVEKDIQKLEKLTQETI